MHIEKNGKIYTVTENLKSWSVKTESGKVSVSYSIQKELCPTFEELCEYLLTDNKLF